MGASGGEEGVKAAGSGENAGELGQPTCAHDKEIQCMQRRSWAAGVVQRGLERRRPVGVRMATVSRRELKPPRYARSAMALIMPDDGMGGARIKKVTRGSLAL